MITGRKATTSPKSHFRHVSLALRTRRSAPDSKPSRSPYKERAEGAGAASKCPWEKPPPHLPAPCPTRAAPSRPALQEQHADGKRESRRRRTRLVHTRPLTTGGGRPHARRCGGTPGASHAPLSHTANDRHGSKRFARFLSSVPFLNETLGDVHFFRADTAGSRGPEGGIQTGQRRSRTSAPPPRPNRPAFALGAQHNGRTGPASTSGRWRPRGPSVTDASSQSREWHDCFV